MRTLLSCALLAAAASGQNTVPATLPFQGRLTLQAGGNANGVLAMTFRIYDQPAGGTLLWSEVQSSGRRWRPRGAQMASGA
jgi:hypothetical protein